MARTIGRVDFIVDLDGKKIPAQARAIGRQIGNAGTQSGKEFSDAFESEFEKGLSGLGSRQAGIMNRAGRLGGERFITSFERQIRSKADRTQDALAHALVNKDALKEQMDGFENVADAVKHFNQEIDALTKKTVTYTNARGKQSMGFAILKTQVDQYKQVVAETAVELEKDRVASEKDARAKQLLADATEKLEAQTARLVRSLSDIDAIRQAGDVTDGYRGRVKALQTELDGLHDAHAIGLVDYERYSDQLERTTSNIEKQIETEKEHKKSLSSMSGILRRIGSSWRRMDGTVKLVIGTILAAGPTVAALGSAVGSGLIAVGGGITSALVGVAAGAAIFTNLFQDIAKAPESMQPTIRSFLNFREALADVNDEIALAAFDKIGGAFDQLDDNVRALVPSLTKVGGVLGDLIHDFAEGTAEGSDGFEEIDKAIQNAAPNLDSLGRTVGTFGVALFRAFNRAQPLVEDMFGWFDKLATRFDSFTQSDDFAEWVENGQRVWSAFSDTLDAVSRALSDLVTPDAIDNTVKLLENLERLAPSLGDLLSVFGALDPIGLLVDILADIGEVMAPLTPVMVAFAEGLNNIVEAVPPGVWVALAAAVTAFTVALTGLKVATFVAGAIEPLAPVLGKLLATLKPMPNAITGATKGLSALGKAGVIGAVAVGAVIAADGLNKLHREILKVDERAKEAVATNASITDSYTEFGKSAFGVITPLTDAQAALDNLTGSGAVGMLGSIGNAFRLGGGQANALSQTLGDLSPALATLAQNDLPAAQQQFANMATELGASDEQVLKMLDTMPEFKAALEQAAGGSDGLATQQEILETALGKTDGATGDAIDSFEELAESSDNTLRSIEDLSSAILGFGSTQLAANEAQRGFSESITEGKAAFEEYGAAFSRTTGQFNLATEAGLAQSAALDAIAESTLKAAATTEKNTGSQEAANAEIERGRQALIKQAEQYGMTHDQAVTYADGLNLVSINEGTASEKTRTHQKNLQSTLEQFGLNAEDARIYAAKLDAIPDKATTDVMLKNAEKAQGDADAVKRSIENIPLNWNSTVSVRAHFIGGNAGNFPSGVPGYGDAAGRLVTAPRLGWTGEDGPEAIVPLRRPLSMVDPSVRALSAVAQGFRTPEQAGFGGGPSKSTGTSKTINIAQGAIQINAPDPWRAANETVNQITERAVG